MDEIRTQDRRMAENRTRDWRMDEIRTQHALSGGLEHVDGQTSNPACPVGRVGAC